MVIVLILSLLAAEPVLASSVTPLENAKDELRVKIKIAIDQANCLINTVDGKAYLFSSSSEKSKHVMTKEDYEGYISDLKKNVVKENNEAEKIINSWDINKSSVENIKQLQIKVSESLRAMSSFISQPVNAIKMQIQKEIETQLIKLRQQRNQLDWKHPIDFLREYRRLTQEIKNLRIVSQSIDLGKCTTREASVIKQ